MTAYDVRGQLVAALREFWQSGAGKPLADLDITAEALDQSLADALLPVVSRIADQRAGDALREAADDFAQTGFESVRTDSVEARLRARAARLAPPTEPKEQR